LERKAPPTFDVVIELLDFDRLAVHHTVQKTVDLMLRGIAPRPELRVRTEAGSVEVVQKEFSPEIDEPGFNERFPSLSKKQNAEMPTEVMSRTRGEKSEKEKPHKEPTLKPKKSIRIYPYGIARTRLERAIRERRVAALITNDIHQADAVISIRSVQQAKPGKLEQLGKNVQIVTVKSNTFSQISGALDEVMRHQTGQDSGLDSALEEAAEAVKNVLLSNKSIELTPRDARLRKHQHQFVEGQRLATEAVGQEPERRIRVLPVKLK
jgi:hypothetical protein